MVDHITEIEDQNNLPHGFFKSLMTNNNISYQYFQDRMKFDILLRRIQQTLFPKEYINPDDINQIAIDSNAKPTKFSLRIFTSNDLSTKSYKQMVKFARSLKNCQQKYKINYEKFEN